MSVITDPPQEGFRISQLLYDTRYRSMTIQIVALIGFLLAIGWLINNTLVNLAALGKPLGFGFLWEPAGYDINQRLIEYNSQMTNARAALVGVLNTLLVAVLGCITATILGVLIGVLRLSKNWLVSRLMTVYIEGFRNVPVLLWILMAMAIFIEVFPQPRDFRGEDPAATMKIFESVAITNRGVYLPGPIFNAGSGIVIAAFIASLAAIFFFGKWAKARQEQTGQILPTFWIKLAILIVPSLLIFFIMGKPIDLEIPAIKGFNFAGGIYMRNSLIALWLALSLYTAAFIAETVRSGIMAVSKGQSEAAAALGLRPGRIMNLVILPQALRVIIPPMISQYLNLTKNSSLAIAVGYMDITGTLGGITLNQTGREMECLIILMGIYLVISLTISTIMNWYNERVKLQER
ncbi:amino acid ABC transporter permease [Amylibacter kogurei]|uniref:Amino acid ABC transporter permease n=1 Tax=Paramylibacter kogurei TaxID=1889778 RepID=A0A2G5K4V8_9RHOB|nr:ABC transporter permease subunit [Amylibacter kogurei]PIB23920.1 amino acid ABC transporter permease [Amylibacter kogurei]